MNKILIDLTTARQVLEALNSFPHRHLTPFISDTRTALQEALAQPQPQQEPVAWMCHPYGDAEVEYGPHNQCENCIPLYTSPPARKPLMDSDIRHIANDAGLEPSEITGEVFYALRCVADEAAHGIKGDA